MKSNKLVTAIGGVVLGAATLSTPASANLFTMDTLSSGYEQTASEGKCGEGKCGEGKCGGKKAVKEGKCGEGKCGVAH